MSEKRAWTVRSGRHGERDSWAIDNGLCGGGWREVPDLSTVTSREELAEIVREVYGSEKPGLIPNYTGQLWSLRSRIQPGDLMVLPMKNAQIALGIVKSGYKYLANEPDETKRHVIEVDWKKTDVPKTALKQDLLYTLGSAMTVFQSTANNAVERLWKVLEVGTDPGNSVDFQLTNDSLDAFATAETVDIEEFTRTRIQTLIQENFAGHELTRLVEALLVAEGFVCDRKAPGPDGGVDILAGRGVFGMDSPRLVVQVKSESKQVGDPVLQQLQGALTRFNGEQALLVAWGGITSAAEKFLETEKFKIKLWTSEHVITSLLKNYASLPEDIKSVIRLQQLWVPID